MEHVQIRRCGAVQMPDGSVVWRVWAPRAIRVDLILIEGNRHRVCPMTPEDRGYFRHTESRIVEGQRYAYSLDDGPPRPDPCSLWQPEGVHDPSAVVFPNQFHWSQRQWRGVLRDNLVFYELHVGTFTPEGTFEAIIPRLGALRELGVTAIELMPVAQFPGTRNWGYDGVLPYATQNSYGGPHGLQRLVDHCHAAGLAVFLDVVYNHLGPEGNYLGDFGPYFTDRYKTPWGKAVNYDDAGCDAVRDYVLDNVRMWLEEFHLDGLRLDAVHAIFDLGASHILRAIKEVAEETAARRGFPAHIIAESDLNDPRLLLPPERGGYGLDGQWSDDFHHAVHTTLTGEKRGYYADYGEAHQLARVLETPFLFSWEYSKHRNRKHGASPDGLSGERFVVCIQNHDQVGNRFRGERLTVLLGSPAKERLAASLLLLSPHLPLLFMGEEYGETNPFPFFCSFGDAELIQNVRDGRRREFPEFVGQSPFPDPDAEETFASARLSWSWPEGSHRAGLRRLYKDLLTARRTWPVLRDFVHRSARLLPDEKTGPVLKLARVEGSTGEAIQAFFNLSAQPQPLPFAEGQLAHILFSSEADFYGGARQGRSVAELLPHECVVFGPRSYRAVR